MKKLISRQGEIQSFDDKGFTIPRNEMKRL